MLKFILLTIIFIYVAYKVSGFILRVFDTLLGRSGNQASGRASFGSQNRANTQSKKQQYRQPSDGNVNIDYIPEEDKEDKKKKFAKSFKGGEYIDYEEVNKK